VFGVLLAADGRLEDETFVDLWIDVDMIFVGHGHPLRLDHVLLASLVASVEDQTVALWSKRYECDSVQKGLELVPLASNSRAFIRPPLRVNRRLVKVNDTVGAAVRCRGLTDFLVQKYPCPPGDTGGKAGVHVMSSAHSSSKYSYLHSNRYLAED
jgi:hypothetical protein